MTKTNFHSTSVCAKAIDRLSRVINCASILDYACTVKNPSELELLARCSWRLACTTSVVRMTSVSVSIISTRWRMTCCALATLSSTTMVASSSMVRSPNPSSIHLSLTHSNPLPHDTVYNSRHPSAADWSACKTSVHPRAAQSWLPAVLRTRNGLRLRNAWG